jgi:hypothetical protein
MVTIYDWIPNTKNRLKLMGTVWTFGDSLTEGFKSGDLWARTYVQWKGYIPLTYGEIVASNFEYQIINLGKGGSDNYTIFETFCKNVNKIKENDIVIIGWSDVGRFRLATKTNDWTSLVPNFNNNFTNLENISSQTTMEISVNRLSKVYYDEVNIWINFMENTINNFKIINWSTFNGGKINGLFVKELNQITNETKGEIQDAHFSEIGQKQLSEILLKEIKGNNEKIL